MTRSNIRTLHAAVLAAVVVAGAGLGACGSDDEKPLSVEEFRQQGNAICSASDVELQKEGQKLLGDGKSMPTPDALAEFFKDKALPITRRKLDELEKLKPPAKEEETFVEMISTGREAAEELEEGLKEDPAGFMGGSAPDPFADFDKMAAELELDDCVGAESK